MEHLAADFSPNTRLCSVKHADFLRFFGHEPARISHSNCYRSVFSHSCIDFSIMRHEILCRYICPVAAKTVFYLLNAEAAVISNLNGNCAFCCICPSIRQNKGNGIGRFCFRRRLRRERHRSGNCRRLFCSIRFFLPGENSFENFHRLGIFFIFRQFSSCKLPGNHHRLFGYADLHGQQHYCKKTSQHSLQYFIHRRFPPFP